MNTLEAKIKKMLPHLDEKQKRLYLYAEAESLGRGGKSLISRIANISRPTLDKAKYEFASQTISTRIRRSGGGRKSLTEHNPELLKALENLVEPSSRGCPESPLRWTVRSYRTLANELVKQGHKVCRSKIGDLLSQLGYSLQSNRKKHEGNQHPDRDSQFKYINSLCEDYMQKNLPVISVDTKKKERVGNYKNNGRDYCPKGVSKDVSMHDFGTEKAIPYGVYDVDKNDAFVNVGKSFDTGEFAVASIEKWWETMGKIAYPNASKILINADGGGSNGHRTRLWKYELQKLANKTKLEITVCHFPPGTSKWNKIEHRLFSQISLNWRGVPLIDYETVVQLIGNVKTSKGLQVNAELDEKIYEKGIKISEKEFEEIELYRHEFHGDWNYTIKPKT